MENSKYILEVVSLTPNQSIPHGSILSHDGSVPEVNGTLVYIQSEANTFQMSMPLICICVVSPFKLVLRCYTLLIQ